MAATAVQFDVFTVLGVVDLPFLKAISLDCELEAEAISLSL